MGLDPNRYMFNLERLHLPFYLEILVPQDVHKGLNALRLTAAAAFDAFKTFELYGAQCYFRLCDMNDKVHFKAHVDSVTRLLSYQEQYDPKNPLEDITSFGPTLEPTTKIPQPLLHFHVDEDAYREYILGFASMKCGFLNGPYSNYTASREQLLAQMQESQIRKMDMALWTAWVEGFLAEMYKWEERVEKITVPFFKEIVWELIEKVAKRVEMDGGMPDAVKKMGISSADKDEEKDPLAERYAFQVRDDTMLDPDDENSQPWFAPDDDLVLLSRRLLGSMSASVEGCEDTEIDFDAELEKIV